MTILIWLLACEPKPLPPGDDDDTVGDDDDTVGDDDDTVGDDDDDDCGCADDEACVDDVCVSCAPSFTIGSTREGAVVQLDRVDPARALDELSLLGRPLTIAGEGVLNWSGDAVIEVLDPSGAAVQVGDEVSEGVYQLFGITDGEATLSLDAIVACDVQAVQEQPLRVRPPRGLVARTLDGDPGFERVQLYGAADTIHLALDAVDHDDRDGLAATVYVVADRDGPSWVADPSLSSAAVVLPLTLGVGLTELWAALPVGPGFLGGYDVVVDLDGDGALSPGDLIDGIDGPALGVVGDLSAPGPHPVATFDWSGAGRWIEQRVYYPDALSSLEPIPVVIISHGNGHDYRWYDYLGEHLASWGYLVMSHANNTGPGPESAAVTTIDNTNALIGQLANLGGGALANEVDTSRIAWVGHSRGGEGVVLAYSDVQSGQVNPANFSASDIVLVSSIAPTIFEGPAAATPRDVRYHLLAGSSDGDVTGGPECDICQYFRLFKNGTAEAWVSYFQGSTHNDFHDVERGAFDDGELVDGLKIGPERTQLGARAYYLALFEHVLNDQPLLDEVFERPPEFFRPEGVDFVVSTQSRREPSRRVIEDYQAEPSPTISSSGGAVSSTVTAYAEGLADDANMTLNTVANDTFNGMTWSSSDGVTADRVSVFEWTGPAELVFEIPTSLQDQSDATHLSFRAAQVTRHPLTDQVAGMLNFEVVLVDAAGVEVGFDFDPRGGIPRAARRVGLGAGSGWVNEFQTIRMPLDAYTADGSGLDLSQLAEVKLVFGSGAGSEVGRIGLDDVEFLVESKP
jgi:hypothetical protein